ncbi:hypothetical protein BDK51DRAFT_27475 [Blyttiomyces helicus]|uniref:Uncharacterized protein n=1 Tax=Blyttiomyces helicus TaxID=388810 RepID=A0A4P9W4K6_9FUNG|nr:hypothetical protein BDK51DRAFT_27475 [Blyttiomyces helicus]|eukprot:RKO87134.1 hypothetical protein BDK51DRAFT_27475 [Blyttiomyces helicus]
MSGCRSKPSSIGPVTRLIPLYISITFPFHVVGSTTRISRSSWIKVTVPVRKPQRYGLELPKMFHELTAESPFAFPAPPGTTLLGLPRVALDKLPRAAAPVPFAADLWDVGMVQGASSDTGNTREKELELLAVSGWFSSLKLERLSDDFRQLVHHGSE